MKKVACAFSENYSDCKRAIVVDWSWFLGTTPGGLYLKPYSNFFPARRIQESQALLSSVDSPSKGAVCGPVTQDRRIKYNALTRGG